ncbi:hypothetical protein ABZ714_26725 [Streptomyces sp. NPDC006798]|uniref:hypothetical protein n=1 Tax=Streptomyces sp. NPDC006798 TaxID=3155462 RepID=UPI0033FD871F
MTAPITVHPPSPTGGRRVTAGGSILGLAFSDRDLAVFLERAGLEDAESLVDADSSMIEWRGAPAHVYTNPAED